MSERLERPQARASAQATCWNLVRNAADGDAAARSIFAGTYLGVVRDFLEARWRGRQLLTEIEDVAQEVFIELLKPSGALQRLDRSKGNFRGLLYTVTRNVARRHEERAVGRQELRPVDSSWMQRLAADEPGQETLFQSTWARALVREARELQEERASTQDESARLRAELLKRRFRNDESIADIAEELGVPAQDLHNAYRKARREFQECLREVVAFHSPSVVDVDAECRSLIALLK